VLSLSLSGTFGAKQRNPRRSASAHEMRVLVFVILVGSAACAEPGGSVPGDSEPDNLEPASLQPSTSEPGSLQPDGSEPGSSEPVDLQPDGSEPGGSEHSTSEPCGLQPGGSEPGGFRPEGSVAGGSEWLGKPDFESYRPEGSVVGGSQPRAGDDGSSLAIVFDTTRSMYPELDHVKRRAAGILQAALSRRGWPVRDFVLAPFNDPSE